MTEGTFKPIAYLLESCPFCLKFMIFLQEGGLLDQFEVRSFKTGTPEQEAIRAELEPHVDKIGFSTVQVAPGKFIRDSDALMEHYAPEASATSADMPLLKYYLRGVFPTYGQLFRENMQLKAAAKA